MAIRTVNAVDLISGIADLCGLDRSVISTVDFQQIRQSMDRRLQTAYEFDFWPTIEKTEKRYYRDLYSAATAYVAPTLTTVNEVYFPQASKYYQALVATTGNPPADINNVTDTTRWADSKTSYSGAATYSASVTYTVGQQVYYPTTDRFYQLYVASSLGNLPSDTTKWGVLTEFDRYVSYTQTGQTALGDVISVYDTSPKLTTRATEYAWYLSENGVQVLTTSNWAWITFKTRTLRLRGDLWVNGTSYAIGDQAYYSTGVPGNFYDCIQATSSQLPTVTTFWTATAIPLIFQRYIELGGHADWLRNSGQGDRADDAEALAQKHLDDQQFLLVGSQSQQKRTLVQTR